METDILSILQSLIPYLILIIILVAPRLLIFRMQIHINRFMWKRKNDLFVISNKAITENLIYKINDFVMKSKTPEIDIIINSPGGDIFSSLSIVDILKNSGKKINIFIPYFSMSGGTLLALTGDNIFMTPNSSIGAIDPQVGIWYKGMFSKASLDYVIKNKKEKATDDSFALRYIAAQYETTLRNTLKKLRPDMDNKNIDFLTTGKIEHGFRITPNIARSLGIMNIQPVPNDLLELIFRISKLNRIKGYYYKKPFLSRG